MDGSHVSSKLRTDSISIVLGHPILGQVDELPEPGVEGPQMEARD
jgi:hypothetical protein